MSEYDIVIVGGGPSGCSSALELVKLDKRIAENVLLLDKAVFPRPKLCAGGVSVDSDAVLRELGVVLDLPAVPVHTTQFILPTGRLTFQHQNQFRILRRTDLDHFLLKTVQARGVTVHEGEAVLDVTNTNDRVMVRTANAEYKAKILIAADGANSKVRASLGLTRAGRMMVAMELHVPRAQAQVPNFTSNMAVLDLRVLSSGVPGYCWVFPTVSDGEPVVSLGLMSAPFVPGDSSQLKSMFGRWLSDFGLDLREFELSSHPALRYEAKAPCSQRRVLFVGDAAGVEPLFGEGIVSALAYGKLAAKAALEGLSRHDFSFSGYDKSIRSSSIGSLMRRRRMIARRLYTNPTLARLFLKQGALIKGLALLHAHKYGGQIFWDSGPTAWDRLPQLL